MRNFTQNTTLMGRVVSIDEDSRSFVLRTRSRDDFRVDIGPTTEFRVLSNIDGFGRDRYPKPKGSGIEGDVAVEVERIRKYLVPNAPELVAVQGIYQEDGDSDSAECKHLVRARYVHLLRSFEGRYLFEESHWWIAQITKLADQWLDQLFGDRREYTIDDFSKFYRTVLNITGQPTDDNVQETATLSRLIYGLSSAYLLTGSHRYLRAAQVAVEYQRNSFRQLSHDGRHCFWAYGRRSHKDGTEFIVLSQNADDKDTLPLYEQIYALAGLAQYYRITADWEVLEDIRRTVRTFNDDYLDDLEHNAHLANMREEDRWGKGRRGYFSHLDFATMRPDAEALDRRDSGGPNNRAKKNWNSIGDHIPAYLINLILALDPLPDGRDRELTSFLETCRWMLRETSDLIVENFPDPDPNVPFVRERFEADWEPDKKWGWQLDRAIVGHNLKIAWNLTRVANYFLGVAGEDEAQDRPAQAAEARQRAERLLDVARRLGHSMAIHGIDQVRGGCFDAVERTPKNGMPVDFAWDNTKDFWQQEQGVLAYLILHGATGEREFLDLAREMTAFWNLFFLDHDNRGIFFRVTDTGTPYIQGNYGNKAGHSMSGYHVFELNYLAHIYIRSYMREGGGCENNFCLYFKPDRECGQRSLNVLPDFFEPGALKLASITVNGVRRTSVDADNFQIPLSESELGSEIVVEYCPQVAASRRRRSDDHTDGRADAAPRKPGRVAVRHRANGAAHPARNRK